MTRSGIHPNTGSGGDRWAPPLLFVVVLGIFFEGGDWPPATFLIRISLFLLAALYLLRRDSLVIRLNAVDLLVLALFAVEAVSLARADYPWVSYQWFLHHAAALVLYLLARALWNAETRSAVLLGALVLLAAAAELAIGGYQLLVRGDARPHGTLQNPNFLAEFLVYAGIVAFSALKRAGTAASRPLPIVAFAVPAVAGVWLTGSRGGFLVALAVGGYLAAEEIGWRRTIPAVAAAALLLLFVSGPLSGRLLGHGDPYAFERLNMWRAAARIFVDHPLGVGVGHFKYYWHALRDPVAGADTIVRYARAAMTPHSEFFSLLSELGVAGGAAFLGFGVIGALSLRRASREGDRVASGACLILLASYLHSFVETNYHIIGLLLVNAAALALVSERYWTPLFQREVRIRGAVRGAALSLLAAMIVYSGMTVAGTVLDWRGQALLAAGRPGEAEQWFLRASGADPWRSTYPDSVSAVRYRLYRSGSGPDDLLAAIESGKEARRRNPLDFAHSSRLGSLHAELAARLTGGESREMAVSSAMWYYDQALKLSPRTADVHYQKALLLRAAGRREESLRVMGSILRIEPNFAKGWVLLGEMLERDDAGRAVEAYERAVELKSRYEARASDPMEKEFLDFPVGHVEKRLSVLKKARKR